MVRDLAERTVSLATATLLALAPGGPVWAAGPAEDGEQAPADAAAAGDENETQGPPQAAESETEGDASAAGEGQPDGAQAGEGASEPSGTGGEPVEGEPAEGEAAEEPAGTEAGGPESERSSAAEDASASAETSSTPESADGGEAEPPAPPAPSMTDTGPQRPEEPRIGGKPAKGVGLMAAGGALLGVGVAGIVTTALMTRGCSFDGPLKCKYRSQDSFLIPLATAPAVLGAILLGVGIGYRVRYRKWETWTPERDRQAAVVPFGGRTGGGLAVVGRF